MLPNPDSIRILTLISSVVLLFLGFKKPVFPFLGFMVIYYCKVPHYYPFLISTKFELVYGLILIIICIINYLNLDKDISNDSIVKSFYFFLIAYALSFLFSWNHTFSWDKSTYHFIKILIITFGILTSLKDDNDVKIAIWGIVFIYLYMAYEPMYRFLTKTSASIHMYGDVYVSELGILSGHVSLANNMNQMIPIAGFLVLTVKNKILRIFSSIPLLVFLLCLVGSKSRGGVVGLILFMLLITIFARKFLRSKLGLIIIVGVLIIFGSILAGTFSRINPSSTEGRLIRIVHGIEMIRRGNFFGVGPGCFILASGKYFGHSMMSHNLYGQLPGELGILGTITWFLFIKRIIVRLNSIRKSNEKALNFSYYLSLGLLISIIIRLFVGLGSHSLYFFNWYVFGMITVHLSNISNTCNDPKLFNEK